MSHKRTSLAALRNLKKKVPSRRKNPVNSTLSTCKRPFKTTTTTITTTTKNHGQIRLDREVAESMQSYVYELSASKHMVHAQTLGRMKALTHSFMQTRTHVCTHVHTHAHTHMHTRMHAHTHAIIGSIGPCSLSYLCIYMYVSASPPLMLGQDMTHTARHITSRHGMM